MDTDVKVLLPKNVDAEEDNNGSKEKKTCACPCRDIITASIWVIGFQLVSFGLGFCFHGDPDWMRKLKQSILTPPPYVFGIVWPILYTMLGIYSWTLSKKRKIAEYNDLYYVSWLQMIINWSYMPVFFYFHLLVSAELVLFMIVGLTGYMIMKLWLMKSYKISLLLIPYFLWCSFATYLSTMIIILN